MAGETDADKESEIAPSDLGRSDAEARIRSIHAIWEMPREVQPEPDRTEPVVSVNVLCLLGAIVGVISLFLPWCTMVEGPNEFSISLHSLVMDAYGASNHPAVISAFVFIIGTVVAFLFPAAFAIQAAGIVLFFRAFMDIETLSIVGDDFELSLGFYAGILSSLMVLAGLIHPVGPGYDHRWPWWSRRMEVSGRANFLEGRLVKQCLAMPGEMANALRAKGSRVYVTVIVVSLMTGLLLVGFQIYQTPEPATATEDGVDVVVGAAATYVLWDYTRLSLTDGSVTVNWTAESVSWVDSLGTKENELSMAYFGTQNLSGLFLGLTVVDVTGDGHVTPGDMMSLVSAGGFPFADDVSYRLTISSTYEWHTYPLHIYASPFELYSSSIVELHLRYIEYGAITFEFEDGEVTSSSADREFVYFEDPGLVWVLSLVLLVASGSAILGAAYYIPVRAIRRRVLAGPPSRADSLDTSDGG